MNRLFLVLLLLSPLKDCKIEIPGPSPSPTPSPTAAPTPEPTPAPTPEPTPTPTPTPTPEPVCTLPLDGQPSIDSYWLYPNVVDSTPKIHNPERCNLVGYPGRIRCPVAAEDHPQRYVCEQVLMGGPRPAYELQVAEGFLAWDYEDDWKARVYGTGIGRIRSCFPNGKACSEFLEIKR